MEKCSVNSCTPPTNDCSPFSLCCHFTHGFVFFCPFLFALPFHFLPLLPPQSFFLLSFLSFSVSFSPIYSISPPSLPPTALCLHIYDTSTTSNPAPPPPPTHTHTHTNPHMSLLLLRDTNGQHPKSPKKKRYCTLLVRNEGKTLLSPPSTEG